MAKEIEDDILVWVKRFLVYRAGLVAFLALTNKNKVVLEYCIDIMRQYQNEYLQTNQQYPERIEQHYEIMAYKL
jgi:hypothetical protein